MIIIINHLINKLIKLNKEIKDTENNKINNMVYLINFRNDNKQNYPMLLWI